MGHNSKECLRTHPEHQAPKPARADPYGQAISVGLNQPAPLPGYPRGNAPTFLRIKSACKICFFPYRVKLNVPLNIKWAHFDARRFRAGIAGSTPFSVLWGKLECRMERALAPQEGCGWPQLIRDSGCKPDRVRGVPPGNLYPSNLRTGKALPSIKRAGSG